MNCARWCRSLFCPTPSSNSPLPCSASCWPTLLCHRLVVENDRIVDYQLRIREQKREAVAAFKRLNYHVISAGDSYNDTAMLLEANVGFLIHAPENVKQEFPQFKAVESLRGFVETDQKRHGLNTSSTDKHRSTTDILHLNPCSVVSIRGY